MIETGEQTSIVSAVGGSRDAASDTTPARKSGERLSKRNPAKTITVGVIVLLVAVVVLAL